MPKTKIQHDFSLLKNLSAEKNLDRALNLLVDELSECISFDGIVTTLVDAEHEHLVCHKVSLPPSCKNLNDTMEKYSFSLKTKDALCNAFHQCETIQVDISNIDQQPLVTRNRLNVWQSDCVLFVPLKDAQDETFGVVLLIKESGVFSKEEVRTAEQRLALCAGSLFHCHRYQQIQIKEKALNHLLSEQEAFLSFTNQLMKLSSEQEICETVNTEFRRRYPFDFACIMLKKDRHLVTIDLQCDPLVFGKRHRRVTEFFTKLQLSLSPDQGAMALCFVQNTPFHIPDASLLKGMTMSDNDKIAVELLGTPRTIIHLPLHTRTNSVGTLSLVSVRDTIDLGPLDQKIITYIGEFVGNALKNAALYTQVKEQKEQIESLNSKLQLRVEALGDMAIRDPLTRLYNFGYFRDQLNLRSEEYARHSTHQSLSLILLDVDHFKHFNDTYGHQAGNEVLQRIAECLLKHTRKMDIACRYGGEEFVCILPMCNEEKALECAERIRLDISNLVFHFDHKLVRVTASFGIAEMTKGLEAETLIEIADQALYTAKDSGRNQCVSAASSVPATT